jgi:hypothetical protein
VKNYYHQEVDINLRQRPCSVENVGYDFSRSKFSLLRYARVKWPWIVILPDVAVLQEVDTFEQLESVINDPATSEVRGHQMRDPARAKEHKNRRVGHQVEYEASSIHPA